MGINFIGGNSNSKKFDYKPKLNLKEFANEYRQGLQNDLGTKDETYNDTTALLNQK